MTITRRKTREQEFACVVHDAIARLQAPAKRYAMSPDASANWPAISRHLHEAISLARGVMTAKDLLRQDLKP